ncbi:MAG: DNA polymerase III subunit chi [Burkholderiaceae bacterium]
MTKVDFHFNAPDKFGYACRLVRKIYRAGHEAVVWSDDEKALAEFDQRLWSFSGPDFIPHVMHSDPNAAATPVVLATGSLESHHHGVIVNLGVEPPPIFGRFERLIEVVTRDETDRQAGRERWRFYRDRGYDMTRHDLSAS